MPEFVNLEQDMENRRLSLTVQDANVKQQKEMWGTSFSRRFQEEGIAFVALSAANRD